MSDASKDKPANGDAWLAENWPRIANAVRKCRPDLEPLGYTTSDPELRAPREMDLHYRRKGGPEVSVRFDLVELQMAARLSDDHLEKLLCAQLDKMNPKRF